MCSCGGDAPRYRQHEWFCGMPDLDVDEQLETYLDANASEAA